MNTDPSKTEKWPRQVARIWIMMLLFITCLLYSARTVMPVCAVTMSTQFSWSKRDSGVVMSGFFYGYCLTQVLGGYASDRIGGEKVLLLSSTAWTLVTAITPVSAHLRISPLITMTAARFFMGLFQGIHYPCLTSVCARRVEEGERGFVMSVIGCGSHLGVLFVGGLGSVILEVYSWESVFLIVGVLSALCTFSMWKYLFTDTVAKKASHNGSLSDQHQSAVFWRNLCMKPAVLSMFFTHLCFRAGHYTLLSWLPTFFKEVYPHAKGWVFNMVPWFVAMVSSLLGGSLSSYLIKTGYSIKAVRKFMQFCSMGISSIFLLLLCGNPSFGSAVALVSAVVGLGTFNNSGVMVNVHDLAPSCAGALYGMMNTCSAISGLLVVYFSGYLADVTDSWDSVFCFLIFVNAVGLLVFLVFGDAQRFDLDQKESDISDIGPTIKDLS
ncbi:voltage-gated purine nucleotide uniporter SLC17A9-like isoform X2 [Engraulis encrasicolus]|uniref:voltage-gated purine nucleotide uniporter SLC17A9-like isoform X2 n=1 Tax=Engraulis encrasicolus TaxID=184585 RepID=UPI002FD0FF0D